jgi:peptidoglycan/LPS O-acetylase OafA/YrhL
MLSNPTAIKRDNNFDIVRLLLAETVVLFHAHHLSAQPALKILPKMFSGGLAVEGFFAISGFLIFSSYERATSLGDYSMKRAARILPGYWLSTSASSSPSATAASTSASSSSAISPSPTSTPPASPASSRTTPSPP